MPIAEQVDHVEADVVSGASVLAARIPEPNDELQVYYFFSLVSLVSSSVFSTLPFLMTSGSAGAAVAAAATASAVAAAGASSARGVTTWTIIMSASLVA